MLAHADAAGVEDHVAGGQLGEVAVVDELGHGGEIVVDIVGQGFGAGLKYIGDVDLTGAVVGQDGAHSAAGPAAAKAEEHGLVHLDSALFGKGGVEAHAVGVVANKLALGGFDHSVAGAHFLTQGVQLVQIAQGLREEAVAEDHPPRQHQHAHPDDDIGLDPVQNAVEQVVRVPGELRADPPGRIREHHHSQRPQHQRAQVLQQQLAGQLAAVDLARSLFLIQWYTPLPTRS